MWICNRCKSKNDDGTESCSNCGERHLISKQKKLIGNFELFDLLKIVNTSLLFIILIVLVMILNNSTNTTKILKRGSVEVSGSVQVSGSVDVDNTVDVEVQNSSAIPVEVE